MVPSIELSRILVAAGIPDDQLLVSTVNFSGTMTWASFHRAALYTYTEGKGSLNQVKWSPFPASKDDEAA